eukprot:m.150027 g.150027  ORF g.150027 m.150027 type:complete len:73 (+) comp17365_c0_seq1:71-289(+)
MQFNAAFSLTRKRGAVPTHTLPPCHDHEHVHHNLAHPLFVIVLVFFLSHNPLGPLVRAGCGAHPLLSNVFER